MSFLLRNTPKSNSTLHSFKQNTTLPTFLVQFTKSFSTETHQSKEKNYASLNILDSTPGVLYGKLFGIRKHTLKTDIINFLQGSNLTADDIKFAHSRSIYPIFAILRFQTKTAYDNAQKTLTGRTRIFRMDRSSYSVWEAQKTHDGKSVVLEGLPMNVNAADIARFLSGCEFDSTSMNIFTRYPDSIVSRGKTDPYETGSSEEKMDPIRMAIIRFPTHTEAMNAAIKKNRSFCLNNQISVRVLH